MSDNATLPLHVMVDIETAGTAPDAVILSIGAVVFGRDGLYPSKEFFELLHVGAQLASGRSVDPQTLALWQTADTATRERAFSGITDPTSQLMRFSEWFRATGAVWIWANGASVYFSILSNALRTSAVLQPWDFRHEMDARSLHRLTGIKPSFAGCNQHDALADAIAQAAAVHEALHALNAWDRFDTMESANAPV